MAEEISSAVTLPALTVMVDVAREHVGHVLDDMPPPGIPPEVTDRAQHIAAILASTAIAHGRRTFTVTVLVTADSLRVTVSYDAADGHTSAVEVGHMRRLFELADDIGHDRADDGASLLWAEITRPSTADGD